MHIDISEIRKFPEASTHYNLEWPVESIEFNGDEIKFDSPLNITLDIRNNEGLIELNGQVTGDTTLVCGRCLEKYPYHLETEISERFSHSSDLGKLEEDGINTEEITVFEGNRINLDDVIRENVLLGLPMKFLCREDCKGLCPVCGTNLNNDKCSCESDNIDPRLEVLKKFFER